MSPSLELTFALAPGEYRAAARRILLRHAYFRLLVAGSILCFVLQALGGRNYGKLGLSLVAIAAAFVVVTPFWWLRQSEVGGRETRVDFRADAINVSVDGMGSSSVGWQMYTGVIETPSLFVLERRRRLGMIIPRRVFPNGAAEDHFRRFVLARISRG